MANIYMIPAYQNSLTVLPLHSTLMDLILFSFCYRVVFLRILFGFFNDDIILSFPLPFPPLKHSHMTVLAIVQIYDLLFIVMNI